MQSVFSYFDRNNDGLITRGEWDSGIAILNEQLDPEQRFNGVWCSFSCELICCGIGARFFDILDMENTGAISYNELCEGYRIARLDIGKLDQQ